MFGEVNFSLKVVRAFFKLGRVAPTLVGKAAHEIYLVPAGSRGPTRHPTFLKAERIRLAAAPLQTAYRWGEGPRVLLVHGWESRSEKFSAYIEPLLSRGYEVIAVDAKAHGASKGRQLDFGAACDTMTEILRELSPRCVIAHSYGAATVIYGLAHQQTLETRVALISPIVTARHISETFLRFTQAPPAIHASYYEALARRWGHPVDHYTMPTFAGRINGPVLLIHDRYDPLIPYRQSRELADAWPAARFITTTSLGHHKIATDPTVREEVLRFLDEGMLGNAELAARSPGDGAPLQAAKECS